MGLIALALFPSLSASVLLSLVVVSLTALSSIGIGIGVTFPVFFLSGAIFPLNRMPGYLRAAARLIPFTWAFDTLNGVMLRSDPASMVLRDLLVITAFGAALLLLGSWLIRRTD